MIFNHELLVLARESRGLTQKQLSEATGVVQATVSKIEKGFSIPGEELLEQFSTALKYPVKFFYQDPYFRVRGHFRKKSSLPEKQTKSYIARMTIVERHFTLLQDAVELPETDLPSWDLEEDGGTAEMAALFTREKWRTPKGRVDNLVRLIEDNGIVVIMIDLGEMDGFSTYSDSGYPIIFANRRRTSDRIRFSIAHELAHLVLHWGKKLTNKTDDRDVEAEADEFASEFLMPSQDILPYLYKLTPQRLSDLKSYWKTSMYSIARKAKNLGKISQDQYYYMMKSFAINGYRRFGEPELFEAEKPWIFDDILSLYLNELGYSLEDLAKLLVIDIQDLEELYFNKSKFAVLR